MMPDGIKTDKHNAVGPTWVAVSTRVCSYDENIDTFPKIK